MEKEVNNKENSKNLFKVIKDKFILAPFKYLTVFIAGVVFASGLVYAWEAAWHGTDWIQSGQVIRAKEIGENMQYLYERTQPLANIPTCTDSNKALQWDGSSFVCATISSSSSSSGGGNQNCDAQDVQGDITIKHYYCNSYTGESRKTVTYHCPKADHRQTVDCSTTYYYSRFTGYGKFQCTNGVFVQRTQAQFSSSNSDTYNCSCFTSKTLITMADGSKKTIADVKVGDKVLSKDGINTVKEIEIVPLAGRKLYSINNSSFFVTAEHPFLTTDGWKSISPEATKRERAKLAEELNITELKVGDKLITQNGIVKIESINGKNAKEQKVYNLILDGDKTYYADEFLVHNKM